VFHGPSFFWIIQHRPPPGKFRFPLPPAAWHGQRLGPHRESNITTFFLAQSDLLRPGSHKLEVLINGTRAADESFDIRDSR
jgi:hypothetical protein